ncbi:uncharacterized protein LOC123706635 [Pieris brassicae]|uniref:uncharacterized protein LOC123706635 n=1 Tax=Pieris brassicae TaxID=7116 RepID=UPI001E65E984|nr:uncharacterized protein LOC123706635 [Pieris brassicae]
MSFDTERFIIEIENRPCLWNKALKEYSDRNLKIKCWDEMVNIFKEKEDITNEGKNQLSVALQRKWKSIRGCFTREVGRQKNLKTGSGGGLRKSEYVFFQQLQFLKNVVAVKEPEDVVAEPAKNSKPDIQMVERKENKEHKPLPKQEQCPEDDKFLVAPQRTIEASENFEAKNDDEDRLFMLSLVGTLKKVSPERKMSTKIKIMSILENATKPEYYP